MLGLAGLGLIVLAWGYQAYFSKTPRPVIQKNFILLYVTGAALLVVDGVMNTISSVTMLNCATALLASLVIIRSSSAENAPKSKSKRK